MSKLVTIRARLSHPNLTSGETIRIKDADIATDDVLATVTVKVGGIVEALIDLSDAKTLDSPLEWAPDIYFEWFQDNHIKAVSDVFHNVDFYARNAVTGMRHDGAVDLGDVSLKHPE